MGGLFKVPLSVFNYQSAKNQQTYFTSLFFFVLIIQTSYEQIGELRTKVTTRYAIGSSGFIKFLLPIVFPLMKWSIKKNFDDLMSGDIPMRTRRGELRKMGYCFKGDDKDYSFVETTKIMENNLISPKMEYLDFVPFEKILSDLEKDNPSLYGDSGILGFQAYKIADKVKLFPRICPHEGACLDRKKSGDNHVRCEWHGRLHKPLLEVDCSDKLIKAVRIELENSLPIMVTKNANSEW
ncbi:MAG: hypothetical protein KGQ36_02900 [Rickettsiales bacterium]|nr:hypothetical protein [Rickettsiales bacterium]